MRPRISMREALAEPDLFGRILAGIVLVRRGASC